MKHVTMLAASLLVPLPVFAHHSDAALDMNKTLTLHGTVTEFNLRNPHAYFTVETTDERGQTVDWSVQMASAITLSRRGWTRDSLALGETVTVAVHPARDGRAYAIMVSVEKENGTMLPTVGGGSRRYASAGGDAPHATSIAGKWIVDRSSLGPNYPGGLDQLMNAELKLTAKGQAAAAAYSQDTEQNDPLLQCRGRPTPSMIVYTDLYPIQIEFDKAKQTATIRSQFFDEVRTVYMDGRSHPPANERTYEGHSIGHWEGDTLVVDTTNFTDHRSPYQNGIPSGAQKHVVERYQLTADGTRMEVEFTLEDPEYIAKPMTHRRTLIYSPDIDMSPFNCNIESTRRYLPQSK